MIEEQIARLYGTLELKVDAWFRDIRRAEQSLDKLTKRSLKVRLELDLTQFHQQIQRASQAIRGLGGRVAPFGAGGGMGGGVGAGMVAGGGGGRWRSDYVPELATMLSAEKVAGRMASSRDRGAWAGMLIDERAQNRANAASDAMMAGYRSAQARRLDAEYRRIERESMRSFARQDRGAWANMLMEEREQNRANASMDALIGNYRKAQAQRLGAINNPNSSFSRRVAGWAEDQFGFVPELAVMGSAQSVAGRIQAAREAARAKRMQNLAQAGVGFGNAAMGLPLAMNPWMMGGTMAGAATAGTLGYVAKTGMDREASMATIRRLGAFTPNEMGGLQQSLEQTAYSTPGMNFGKVAEVAAFAAKTGVAKTPEELATYTNSLAKMGAVINDVDFESLATEVARVMNLFELGADKVENFASALYKVDTKSTATAPQILDVMSRLQGFGLAAGMDAPSLMGLSGAIKDVGGRNESATTAMINIMSRLADPSQRRIYEDVLGMAPGSINEAFDRGPMEALSLFTGALNKLPAGDEKLNTIVGDLGYDGKKVLAMLGRVQSKEFGRYAEFEQYAREQMANPTALNEGLAIESGSAKSAVEELTDAISRLAAAASEASGLTDTIRGVAGGLGSAANWLSQDKAAVSGLSWVLSGGIMGPWLSGASAWLGSSPATPPGAPAGAPAGLLGVLSGGAMGPWLGGRASTWFAPPPGAPAGAPAGAPSPVPVGLLPDKFAAAPAKAPVDTSTMFGTSFDYGPGGVLANFARSMVGSPLAQQMLGFGQDVARGLPGMNPLKGFAGVQEPINVRPTSSGVSDALSLVTRQQTQLLEGDILRQQLEVQREIRDAVRNGGGGGAVL